MSRVLGRVHPGESDLRMGIDAGQDVAPRSAHGAYYGVERHEESGVLFFLEFSDAPFGLVGSAFSAQEFRLLRMEVERMFFDDPLDLPRGDGDAVFLAVENHELHLAVSHVRPPQTEDAELLHTGNLPCPRPPGASACSLERREAERVVALSPFVEALPRDAEMAAGQRRVLAFTVMIHPRKPFLRLFGK